MLLADAINSSKIRTLDRNNQIGPSAAETRHIRPRCPKWTGVMFEKVKDEEVERLREKRSSRKFTTELGKCPT